MIHYNAEATIERSAAEIWAVAVDVERQPEWMAVTESTLIEGDPTRVGARSRQVMRMGPKAFRYEFLVTRAEPPRAVTWLIIGDSALQAEASLDLTPISPTATRVVYSGTISFRGPWRLLTPIVSGAAQAEEARELQRLKALMEREPAAND